MSTRLETGNSPLIDSHCHLDFDYSPKQAEDLFAEAEADSIIAMITVSTNTETVIKHRAISERYPQIFHTSGIHPHETAEVTEQDLDLIREMARAPKCLAIGEIGLDYYYQHSDAESQKRRLEDQLQIALDANLPIVVHSRDGEMDLLPALTRYASKVKAGVCPGIIHCFTGTQSFGEACIELGFYISFSGILTFKNSEPLRDCARAFPLERLLVETDSPFLAPVPMRGKKCEPSMVRYTAMKLAEIKKLPIEQVCQSTVENTVKAFKIPTDQLALRPDSSPNRV